MRPIRRLSICCVLFVVLLSCVRTARYEAFAADELPELNGSIIPFPSNESYEVYTGPGTSFYRAGDGKATVSTNSWIKVYGIVDDWDEGSWALIEYEVGENRHRIGFINAEHLPQGSAVALIHFASQIAFTTAESYITDDPFYSRSHVEELPDSSFVQPLARMGEWTYVNYGALCGFVLSDLVDSDYVEINAEEGLYQKISQSVASDDSWTVTTIKNNVNVRKETSAKSKKITTVKSKGTTYAVKDSKLDAEGYIWYMISTAKGDGFIREDFVDVSGVQPAETGDEELQEVIEEEVIDEDNTQWTAVTVKDRVNVREEANKKSGKVATIGKKGTVVEVLGVRKGTDGFQWYEIMTDAHYTGLVREDFLIVSAEPTSSVIDMIPDTNLEAAEAVSAIEAKPDEMPTIVEMDGFKLSIADAIAASRKLSGATFNLSANGGIYYLNQNYAYSYFGEQIAGLYADASGDIILAMLEDGSVYNGTTLISGDAKICDVCWKTHRTNIDAYMLGDDGTIYYYEPYSGEFINFQNQNKVSAICRSLSYAVFFIKEGGIGFPSVLMSGGSANYEDVDFEYWKEAKDIVVGACMFTDRERKPLSIAGISSDGKVYAWGKYAEEIMSVENLVYITMDSTSGAVYCLDDKGAVTIIGGSDDLMISTIDNLPVTGIYANGAEAWYVDIQGNVYRHRIYETDVYTENWASSGIRYLSPDGDVYKASIRDEEAGRYRYEKTDDVNANAASHNNLVLYHELLNGNMVRLTDNFPEEWGLAKIDEFALVDLDGDGYNEVVRYNESIDMWEMGYLYNSRLTFLDDGTPVKVYPRTGIFVYEHYRGQLIYGRFVRGRMERLALRDEFWNNNDGYRDDYYFYGKLSELPVIDEEGNRKRESDDEKNFDGKFISKSEFEAWVKEYVGEEYEAQTVNLKMRKFTQSELASALLNGQETN